MSIIFFNILRRGLLQLSRHGLRMLDNDADSSRVVLPQRQDVWSSEAVNLRTFADKCGRNVLRKKINGLIFQEILFNSFACFLYISTRQGKKINLRRMSLTSRFIFSSAVATWASRRTFFSTLSSSRRLPARHFLPWFAFM